MATIRDEADGLVPLGAQQIAERLGVKPHTVHAWMQRRLLPPADGVVSGKRWWYWRTIAMWATETGRLRVGEKSPR